MGLAGSANDSATKAQLVFLKVLQAAVDPSAGLTEISVENHSPFVMAGNFSDNAIDIGDINKFGQGPGPSSVAVLAHEIQEMFSKQVLGFTDNSMASERVAHKMGIGVQSKISGMFRVDMDATGLDKTTGTGETFTRFRQLDKSFTIKIQWDRGNINSIEEEK